MTACRREYGEEVRTGDRFNYHYLPAAVSAIMEKIRDICDVHLVKPKGLYPQPKIRIIKINPDPATAAILAKLEQDYVVEIDKEIITASNYNKVLTKLQQIGNGFVYKDDGTPVYVNDIKFRYVRKMMRETLDPILVTYSFIPDKERLLSLPGAKMVDTEEEWNTNKIKLGVIYSNKAGLKLQKTRCKRICKRNGKCSERSYKFS